MLRYALLRTVLDPLLAVASPQGLIRLDFLPHDWEYHTQAHAIARHYARLTGKAPEEIKLREDPPAFDPLRDQLAEYFTGRRETFHLPLDLQGTQFQMRVWHQLQKIPFGKLRTYGQVARSLRKPQATRAVGQAAGQNPLPLLVPCHRVVGKSGSLVGFAGGLSTKARLLRLEGHTLGDTAKIEAPRLF